MPFTSVRLVCEHALAGQTELLVAVQNHLLTLVALGPRRARRVGGQRLVALWHEAAAVDGVGLDQYTPAAMLAALQADGLSFLNRALTAGIPPPVWTRVAHHAVRVNDRDVLQLLHRSLEATLQAPFALEIAASGGDLALCQWIHTHTIGVVTPDTLIRAVAKGHLAVVQWLVLETPPLPDWDTVLRRAMDEAAQFGHLDVLQWLCRQSTSVWWSTEALGAALRNSHCDVASWMHDVNEERLLTYAYGWYDPSFPEPDLRAAALEAFSRGDLRVIDWLRARGWLRRVSNLHTQRARRAGHVHVLDYVETHYPDAKRSLFEFHGRDAIGGSVRAAQWALERGLLCNSSRAVTTAARRGHIGFMHWYVGVFDGQLNWPKKEDAEALDVAASKGYMECVVFLVENAFVSVTRSAIERAEQNGHAAVAQWLTENARGIIE